MSWPPLYQKFNRESSDFSEPWRPISLTLWVKIPYHRRRPSIPFLTWKIGPCTSSSLGFWVVCHRICQCKTGWNPNRNRNRSVSDTRAKFPSKFLHQGRRWKWCDPILIALRCDHLLESVVLWVELHNSLRCESLFVVVILNQNLPKNSAFQIVAISYNSLVAVFLGEDFEMGVEIVAHRGASGEAPENTLAAVNLAWQQHADAVEIDVRLTRDGHVVAIHDPTTLRTAGQNLRVSQLTLAELKQLDAGAWKGETWRNERIPTWQEVLASVPLGKRLFVEVKCGVEIVPALVERFKDATVLQNTVIIAYDLDVLAELKRHQPSVTALQVVRLSETPTNSQEGTPTLLERLPSLRQTGVDGFTIGITRHLEPPAVVRLLAENLQLSTWTINDAREALRLENMGIHAVTTDYPGKLRQELEEFRPRPGLGMV